MIWTYRTCTTCGLRTCVLHAQRWPTLCLHGQPRAYLRIARGNGSGPVQNRLNDASFVTTTEIATSDHSLQVPEVPVLVCSLFGSSVMGLFVSPGDPPARLAVARQRRGVLLAHLGGGARREPEAGWHYLSNATCLMRPHLFSTALLVLIRLIIEFAAFFATFEENMY